MVVDFSKINIKEKPMLILRTNDGTPLGTLGFAHNMVAEISYNEVSKLTFDIPAYIEKKPIPHYDDVIGTRVIDLKNVGQFILTNPQTRNDGIREIKECTAYSLEYEFTYKKLSLENSTYNFWNPVAQGGTILGIIMEKMPSWSVGTVDVDLVGKYRTFDVNNENLYNFIKSKIQETYSCIFEFDTYNRKVNVRSVTSAVATEPVYISFNNLIKDTEITEDSESILTCLDVSGADGVDIRSVNPMGINKIYDYNYFMNTVNFSQEFIEKYNSWQTAFESYQLPYYNLTVEYALKITEKLTEQSALVDLYGQLKNLENQQAVIIQSIAQRLKTQSDLNSINSQISSMNAQVSAKKSVIATIEQQIDGITSQMVAINKATAFSAFFTSDEILLLDKYTKEDSISESSFVAPAVKNYNTADLSNTVTSVPYSITDSKIMKTVDSTGKDVYTATGGTLSATYGVQIKAEIIKASYITGTDRTFLLTAYLKNGTIGGSTFESGCVSLTGSISGSTSSDVTPDSSLPAVSNGTRLSFTAASAQFYFTQNTTAYEQRAVEWDLYDYGRDCLSKLATPSFSFSVSLANFLGLEEFSVFKKNLELGNKLYLRINDETVLQPILIGALIDFENPNKFELKFGNTYKNSDSVFNIADLVEQSISMGSKVDFNQFNYNAWVDSGAETQVSQFIKSALDVSKNAIISSSGQAPTLDDSGLRLRKLLDNGEYSPKQVWMNNNSIMFTSNNWNTADIAIGEFVDTNCGSCWGVVAPNIVGTLLAGSGLVIESAKKDGGKSVFRVDGDGAALYNATFDLYNGSNTQITLNPHSGIAIGKYPLYTGNNYTINTDNAQFWVDTAGNLHLKGELHAATGTFSGALQAATGTFSGELIAATGRFKGIVQASDFQDLNGRSMVNSSYQFTSQYLNLLGLNVGNGNFVVDSSGNVSMRGNINMTGGTISWSNINETGSAAFQNANSANNAANNAYNIANTANITANNASVSASLAASNITRLTNGQYSGGTFISGNSISAPYITGGRITGNEIYGSYINGATIDGGTITGSTIRFGNWGWLQQSYGSNGITTTDLIEMYSTRGIRLQAGSGGLGLQASGEIWASSPLNLYYNGAWIRNIASIITNLQTRVANLEK